MRLPSGIDTDTNQALIVQRVQPTHAKIDGDVRLGRGFGDSATRLDCACLEQARPLFWRHRQLAGQRLERLHSRQGIEVTECFPEVGVERSPTRSECHPRTQQLVLGMLAFQLGLGHGDLGGAQVGLRIARCLDPGGDFATRAFGLFHPILGESESVLVGNDFDEAFGGAAGQRDPGGLGLVLLLVDLRSAEGFACLALAPQFQHAPYAQGGLG